MKTWQKGLIIGGASLAVLVPAGLVAADQMGPGNGQGRGNGSLTQHCDHEQMQARDGSGRGRMGTQARDGSGPRHAQIAATTTTVTGG